MNTAAQSGQLTGLGQRLTTAPLTSDPAAARRLDDLLGEAELPLDLAARVTGRVRDLLLALADHSPFLWALVRQSPERLSRLLNADPDTRLAHVLLDMATDCDRAADEAEVMRSLRRARQEVALLVALCDLGGVWDVVAVTSALTRFADAAVAAALRFLLRQAWSAGRFLREPSDGIGSGLVVLALGKLGASELNYSSDIDIIVLFDPTAGAFAPDVEPAPFYVRLTKGLVRLLHERTPDGYVLRVDLRLRPDPGSTAIAIALPSAFAYYETLGQNWERAALIKARPVAGDLALGRRFIEDLAPFIWRKYFDYAAIADIHAMKRQIHAVRGHAEVTVAGHDVKLGRGGIREIEFFVQTQQLVFGGRRPQLRGSRTLDMLAELHRDGWVTAIAAQELAEAYGFLRRLEHRLQMLNDEQTQRLPADPAALARFARFSGFADAQTFVEAVTFCLHRVEKHYARLFEHAPALAAQVGNLVFTGTSDDPETLETLRRLGFKEPAKATEIVRGWHFGRRAAVQGPRAREVLTELVPGLLEAFSGSGDPDAALAAFDSALARLPAAVELFSLLNSNDSLRALFADILGAAPRLARIVTQRPHVLDGAIDPALMGADVDHAALAQRVRALCAQASSFEDFLDRARDVRQEEAFLIGVRLLAGTIAPLQAGTAYSTLAEALVGAALERVEAEFAREHGKVPGGRSAVLAMGKLGSREMTAASDLDLILVYDFDSAAPQSTGSRPLHAIQYYSRLTQRLISALTVPTRRGPLYAVDLRLRPSGNKGPVATQFEGFRHYQENEAETWEHLALTRARVICGDASLAAEIGKVVETVLARARDASSLATDVREMRKRIADAKGDGDGFDLKIAPGGLVDLEFIAQYLVLAHGDRHHSIMRRVPRNILEAARIARVLDRDTADCLIAAYDLLSGTAQIVATCLEDRLDPQSAPEGVLRRIAAAVNLPDFRTLERELDESRARVRALFEALIGTN